jgi:glucose-1-phosphate adenylyltransferase
MVRSGSVLDRVVIMGNRSYDVGANAVPLGVGHDCEIRDAIVDTDVRIGDGCRLVNTEGVHEADGDGWFIRDGIVVIPRRETIPPGTVI